MKPLPPITWSNLLSEIQWISFGAITLIPIITIYGALTVPLQTKTAIFAVLYYFFTGLGITAGYHRLWAHRAYNASLTLQYILACAGAGAVEGSIKWWSRGHRAHHRYTDTDLDPYNAHYGFWWAHVGWMLVKPRRKPGVADISDLSRNPVVRWQHKHYIALIFIMGFVIPTVIPGLLWGDFKGGYFFAGAARLMFVHHSTFCVNSLAHWLGETPFDDKHTPRDHMITAFVTIGEGYHNFHHQFPMVCLLSCQLLHLLTLPQDYRNAIKWYQYDPTKWFIWVCQRLGLASHLKTFPDNEVRKGQLTMQLKRLREVQDTITWASEVNDLPVISWESCAFISSSTRSTFRADAVAVQEQSAKRPLILIAGYIHDLSDFMEEHPGGRHLIVKYIGKDATTAFFGGVYDHSNAAHNVSHCPNHPFFCLTSFISCSP